MINDVSRRVVDTGVGYTIEDASDLLDVSSISVRNWIKRGVLHTSGVFGKSIVIAGTDIRQFVTTYPRYARIAPLVFEFV